MGADRKMYANSGACATANRGVRSSRNDLFSIGFGSMPEGILMTSGTFVTVYSRPSRSLNV